MKHLFLLFPLMVLSGCRCQSPPMNCSSGETATARVAVSEGTRFEFPERELGLVPRTGATGICLSGGGTRALTAAMGQLRGLRQLSLIDEIDYVSCVSGGSWAATAYTYYSRGASGDEQFLGSITEPRNITMSGLSILHKCCLGFTATRNLEHKLEKLLEHGFFERKPPADQVWIDAITEIYLKPFGLGDRSAYFSLDESTVAGIKRLNPALSDNEFHVVRTKDGPRPFLVINACIVGPSALSPFESPTPLTVFQYTPLYVGSPLAQTVHYRPLLCSDTDVDVGGGFVEPFALGCTGPAGPPADGFATLPLPAAPFSLGDAAGTSSSAYSGVEDNFLGPLSPHEPNWPVSNQGGATTTEFNFGDGGNLENYGLISLLQRKVETIVVFINTATKLSLEYDPERHSSKQHLDGNLPPLFGFPIGNMTHNQVFGNDDFATLVTALQDEKRAGHTVMHRVTLDVQENEWWGVAGDWSVDILWVYNDRVPDWESRIGEPDVRRQIDKGNAPGHHGDFPNFPNYKTVGENSGKLIPHLVKLTEKQVNLLADLSCWNVTSNESTFVSLLAPER